MTGLTLLLGIVIGLLMAYFGLALKDLVVGMPFSEDPLLTAEPIPLLAFLLIGAAGLLQWRREQLRAQFPMIVAPRRGASASQRATSSLIAALWGFGLAGVDLVGIIFSLDLSHVNWPGISLVVLLCSSAIVWYLHRRGHRRVAQP